MINEVLEVQQYLNGERINKECLRRICFLIARWYKQQGYNHLQVREAIFAWANKYNIFIDFSVNSIVNVVMDSKTELRGDTAVYVSDDDVLQIVSRFDSDNVRMVALAILCYAKAFANSDGLFDLSEAAIAHWVDIRRSNVSSYYIRELMNYGYIEKVKPKKAVYTWNKTARNKSAKLKIKVSFANEGRYMLVGNDIDRLYHDIFGKDIKR